MAKKLLHSIPWFQSSRRSRGAYIMTDSPCGVRRVSTSVRPAYRDARENILLGLTAATAGVLSSSWPVARLPFTRP